MKVLIREGKNNPFKISESVFLSFVGKYFIKNTNLTKPTAQSSCVIFYISLELLIGYL